jgi:hypothetical protein
MLGCDAMSCATRAAHGVAGCSFNQQLDGARLGLATGFFLLAIAGHSAALGNRSHRRALLCACVVRLAALWLAGDNG